jgi:hypothetical protein
LVILDIFGDGGITKTTFRLNSDETRGFREGYLACYGTSGGTAKAPNRPNQLSDPQNTFWNAFWPFFATSTFFGIKMDVIFKHLSVTLVFDMLRFRRPFYPIWREHVTLFGDPETPLNVQNGCFLAFLRNVVF